MRGGPESDLALVFSFSPASLTLQAPSPLPLGLAKPQWVSGLLELEPHWPGETIAKWGFPTTKEKLRQG